VPNEHILQARLAGVELMFELEMTLRWLDQLPGGGPTTAEDLENLHWVLDFRSGQLDQTIRALQGRVAGVMNLVRLQAEGQSVRHGH
jgi:hypothetical protein